MNRHRPAPLTLLWIWLCHASLTVAHITRRTPPSRITTPMSNDALECRTRQLCEYEAIQAMYEYDDSFVAHDADVYHLLQEQTGDSRAGQGGQGSCSVDTQMVLSFSVKRAFDAMPGQTHAVRFTLPPRYPLEPAAATIEWEHATRADREYVNGVLGQYSVSLAGEEAVMQLLEKSLELVGEVWEEKQSHVNGAELLRDAEAELRQEQHALSQSVLGRRLIYFHHIIAGGKRQAIQEWAVQLRLGGYAKIGWSAKDISEPPASKLALRALRER